MRAVLYARVSSQEQADKGYSLQDQLRTLRAYAEEHGHEVVEEVEDPGYSGASLERPGLNRVSDLVAAGGIGVVLAQDRDRIARDPVISGLLRIRFEQHGTKLRALNDPGDDSPTGDLTAGILDQIAKFERAMTTQRTRRGRFQRAREGKVNGPAPYGFKYDEDRTNFAPDVTMPTVKRIFEMIAAGSTAYAVKKRFESEGIPSPGGGEWFEPSIRRTILNDAYKPHTYEELRELVARGVLSADVLAAADPEESYGVAWFGVNRTTLTPMGDKKRTSSPNPESEWVAVPIPDAGIPRGVVDAARDAVRNNPRPRRSRKQLYELGGMLFCSCCGMRMTGFSSGGYRYYTCQNRKKHGRKRYPEGVSRQAEGLEKEVMAYVQDLVSDPTKLRAQLDAAIEKETATLQNPDAGAVAWMKTIEDCRRKRAAYQEQQAAGLMTLDELGEKLRRLDDAKSKAERELSRMHDGQRTVDELIAAKRAMLEAYEQGIYYDGIAYFSPEMRRELYENLRLKVTVGRDTVRYQGNADIMKLTRGVQEYAEEAMTHRARVENGRVVLGLLPTTDSLFFDGNKLSG